MATLIINKSELQDHINDAAEVRLESFAVDRPHYSFSWTRSGPDGPDCEFNVFINEDFEYEFDITDCDEYTELEREFDSLKDNFEKLEEKNDELFALNDELIKENARLRAEVTSLKASSFITRIFGR